MQVKWKRMLKPRTRVSKVKYSW